MLSTAKLRFYSFFYGLNDDELQSIAMIAEEDMVEEGAAVIQEGDPADTFFFLETGSMDLYYNPEKAELAKGSGDIHVAVINPGEPFGISALIEPYIFTSTVRASKTCRVIRIDAKELRSAMEVNPHFALTLMRRVSSVALERLRDSRIELAAAWA